MGASCTEGQPLQTPLPSGSHTGHGCREKACFPDYFPAAFLGQGEKPSNQGPQREEAVSYTVTAGILISHPPGMRSPSQLEAL